MEQADRREVIWYYRLGDQTLGPVPWTEIEALIGDTVEAHELLVARGGDTAWRTAAEVLAAHPEPAPVAPSVPPPYTGAALLTADATAAHTRVGPGEVPIEFGISRWIAQAWEVLIGDVWPWLGATALVFLIGGMTFGIAAMPLTVGVYMMALRRFEGRPVGAGDVFLGFQRFWSAIGLGLLMMIPMAVLVFPFVGLAMAMMAGAKTVDEQVMPFMFVGFYAIYPLLWLAMLGVQTIFFWSAALVADGHGAWDAVVLSWDKVRTQFWSYLGMYLLLTIIAGIGANLCYVGLLFTWPLQPLTIVAAYRWHFRRP